MINYSSEILYNTSERSEETYKYYSSISDYSELKYENKMEIANKKNKEEKKEIYNKNLKKVKTSFKKSELYYQIFKYSLIFSL